MTEIEFEQWCDDLSRKLPDTGNWMSRNRETIKEWFEFFQLLDAGDCHQALRDLWLKGELAAYDREKIPAFIGKRAQEYAASRKKAALRVEERKKISSGFYDDLRNRQDVADLWACAEESRKLMVDGSHTRLSRAFIDQWIEDPKRACRDAQAFKENANGISRLQRTNGDDVGTL